MKNQGKLLASSVIAILVFISCSDEDQAMDEINPDGQSVADMVLMDPLPECGVIGTDWDGLHMPSNQERTFSIAQVTGAAYEWSSTGSISITSADNLPSVTVKASSSSKCLSGNLYVSRTDPNGAQCGNMGTISTGSCGTSSPCLCPNPVIVMPDPAPGDPNNNCSFKSTGLYTVTVTGVQSGDVLTWSGNGNVHIQNGQGTATVAFYIYNTNADFVINCTVTRNCPGGATFVRTATYGSNISQQCRYFAQYTTGECGGWVDPN